MTIPKDPLPFENPPKSGDDVEGSPAEVLTRPAKPGESIVDAITATTEEPDAPEA